MNKLSVFRYFDLVLFGSSVLLLLLGLLMIYSNTYEAGAGLFYRQVVFAFVGLILMFALAMYDYRNLKKATGYIYLFIVLALIVVWWFAEPIRGSARWIDLGFFRFQPAEFAKLALVIVTAKVLDQYGEKIKSFPYVLLSLMYVLIPLGLIVIQPDLGTALVIFFTWAGMLMLSKVKKTHLLWLFLAFLIAAILAWSSVLHDYQKQRIHTFLNPTADPQGQGYNVLQSIIAVGSGQYLGRGVGRGLQSQLKFLPERQTDFIFASTAEELGFIGSSIILIAFLILFLRLLKTMQISRDNFGMYLSLGVFFMMLTQALVNIGMNLGLLPVTGIPLPLLSYGGSSLITTFLALGIVQSIVARQKVIRFGG
ncbi:MAG: rod shape-determining protein RodA [Candidatus Doudnabacteria bacterium RIFCSPLOWO2_02_FULL_48_8]|uniref:Peptidoglycan glycosyltransferase RodA n=1 Tax=Candidatus Doudnabacteria bacterium RIFCSPHIGHO2_01_FULL_46_24 TaxID=1817825 RepID=A0A1F5NW50_9BACT|nr:MAG: rod shape-determining protein RodA [Candidatus Doudnabacteria bacterium RIFCSPHIGHO2_01_FULL_46_24]OGE95364.1 MAG: rod shape-determining protein RodA [Candidatus Doudnabacteria bacterium RIFCSPHIGHO2_12_FULL_48_11]OGE95780.1 MAG: rod shape-determining protein RodA [Candidatus Doudnabacteria bacterium RIFCSPLOWO2_02_FULL_48_8]